MTILFIKTIILSAVLSVTLPLVNMEIPFDKECELEEELWGEPGPLPVFNHEQNRDLAFNPMHYYADTGDSFATKHLRRTFPSISLALSVEAIPTSSDVPDTPDHTVKTLTLINPIGNRPLTPEQQGRILQLYPQVRYLQLINISLTEQEIHEFTSHFHQLQRPTLYFIANTDHNSRLARAWAKLIEALKQAQTNQEELSSLLAIITNELLKDSESAFDNIAFEEFAYFA